MEIILSGKTYDSRSKLKDRGFRYDGATKTWRLSGLDYRQSTHGSWGYYQGNCMVVGDADLDQLRAKGIEVEIDENEEVC